jgi:DNA-binding MarR family transcriptional regulator
MIINSKINKIIHEPVRFDVMNLLCELKSADFLFLLNECNVTKGNLSSHLSKLEQAGYINVEKGFNKKRPLTTYQITAKGKKALKEYKEIFKGIFQV